MTTGTVGNLYDIWGSGSSDVFALGSTGGLYHWNGSTWSAMSSGTSQVLAGVWGTGPSDVFAVGGNGTILHWNGTAWSAMTTGTAELFRDVGGTGPSDVFAVGNNGTLLHWDGAVWSKMKSGTPSHLLAVWAGADVFAVGYLGTIVRRPRACQASETACSDGKDDDCDGRIDCNDSDCSADPTCMTGGRCTGYTTIACNGSANGTTIGATSTFDAYACDSWLELGREMVYRVTPPTTGPVTATVNGLAADLDLIVLQPGQGGGCDTGFPGCIGSSSSAGTTSESVVFTAQAGQPYYLVVDGYGSNTGTFTLSVTCP